MKKDTKNWIIGLVDHWINGEKQFPAIHQSINPKALAVIDCSCDYRIYRFKEGRPRW